MTSTELPQNVFDLGDTSRVSSLSAHYDGRQFLKLASRLAIKTACMALWIMTAAGEDFASQDEKALSGVHESSTVAIVTKIEEALPSRTLSAIFYSFNLQKNEIKKGETHQTEVTVENCKALFYTYIYI